MVGFPDELRTSQAVRSAFLVTVTTVRIVNDRLLNCRGVDHENGSDKQAKRAKDRVCRGRRKV